ncbi:UDP-glucoronosyl and UDP-glucosyl transferase domain-containing protein [Phthorimaea operculella]|nr:UDP-glucoronosyl and UDP-glucosyl transferase domain-containing protein [Phthorimaea operculella]
MAGWYLVNTGVENCEVMLGNQLVQDLIKIRPKFDLVVMELFQSDCGLGIAHVLGAPVVATTSSIFQPVHFDRFGIPYNPSYVPFHFLEGGTKPNLIQRLEAVVFNFYMKTIFYWISQRGNQNTLAKYFDGIPPLDDLARETKFVLAYQNFALTGSRLQPANVINVAAYHVDKAKPLTGDLKQFIEGAKDGVIYINFGSMMKTSSLPADKVEAILGAMDEFPHKFIWKWEDNTLKYDKNKLYVSSWLPQVDILGHPKTLAFYSHAGMGGTSEAIHYGVPMVAMPAFGDQPSNAAAIEEAGFGVQLHLRHLTKDSLVAALKKVLDPGFQARAKEVSSAWHDRPQSALETAVFWTEFAARHPNMTFRTPAADVPFYQYYCLDIAAVFIGILGGFVFLISLCRGSKKRVPETKRQKTKKRD